MSLRVKPVLAPMLRVGDDVLLDGYVFFIVTDDMVVEFILPVKAVTIRGRPLFHGAFKMIGVHGNRFGHRFAKCIRCILALSAVNDNDEVQVIGHNDELIQYDNRV